MAHTRAGHKSPKYQISLATKRPEIPKSSLGRCYKFHWYEQAMHTCTPPPRTHPAGAVRQPSNQVVSHLMRLPFELTGSSRQPQPGRAGLGDISYLQLGPWHRRSPPGRPITVELYFLCHLRRLLGLDRVFFLGTLAPSLQRMWDVDFC